MVRKVLLVFKVMTAISKVFKVQLVLVAKVRKVYLALLVYKETLDQNFKVSKVELVQHKVLQVQ